MKLIWTCGNVKDFYIKEMHGYKLVKGKDNNAKFIDFYPFKFLNDFCFKWNLILNMIFYLISKLYLIKITGKDI